MSNTVTGWPGRLLFGAFVLAPLLLREAPGQKWAIEYAGLAVVSLVGLAAARTVARGSPFTALASGVALVTGTGLMASAANPLLAILAALLVGYGAGGLVPRRWPAAADAGLAVVFVALAATAISVGGLPAVWALVGAITVLSIPAAAAREVPGTNRRLGAATLWNAFLVAQAGGFTLVIGALSPAAGWFGALESHGSRQTNLVALTFDGGPNGSDTLAIASLLEEAGVRGTFFEVGKAVEAEPGVAKTLLAHGHLVGNHSYRHGRLDYLRPGYPEFGRAEQTLHELLGVCPALHRPPHGAHSPFVSREVNDDGATVVTWDVEAGDWAATDPAALARSVLDQVRPGSIILLHDGLDGNPGADRSVVVRALPAILAGLRAKGLEPVLLDRLLGRPAYLPSC